MFRLISVRMAWGCILLALNAHGSETGKEDQVLAQAHAIAIGSTAPSWAKALPVVEASTGFRSQPEPGRAGYYGVGEAATPQMIAGWDIDIRPDGQGLPPGAGSAAVGEAIYDQKCASCHGVFGEGEGRWPKLASGEALTGSRPEKTVGNYWPYATTLWDYIHRAMPFFAPQSLTDNEVYALVAHILYLNDLIEYEQEVTQHNLAALVMPNRDGFFIDPRPDVSGDNCMSDCKAAELVRVVGDASTVGVTPTEGFSVAQASAEDIAAGKVLAFDRAKGNCLACHIIDDGELPGSVGPPLVGLSQRYSDREVLFEQIWDAGIRNPDTTMPPFGRHRILTDEEIYLIVSYLFSLR